MASVSFQEQPRGRSGRVPLSYFNPVMVTDGQPFWKVMPKNAVPTGKGNRDQQLGYWNEQKRWRMRKGQRTDLDSKWHFYYLGTGPHADKAFRTRLDGVYWVAVQGSKTDPTGLGTRRKNSALIYPQFATSLPSNIQIQTDSGSTANSRSVSQSRDRSASANRSQSRGPQNQNQSQLSNQNQNQNRNRSKSRTRNNEQTQQPPVDIVAAVKEALKQLGVDPKGQSQSGKKSRNTSGSNTPRQERSKSPAHTPPTQRKQLDRPIWKRVPNSVETVTQCFGPRDPSHNFGDTNLVDNGTEGKHWPQIAEFIPTAAALAFGSEITTREVGDEVEVTYTYKMKVKKDDKNLPLFLQQVSAYAQPSQAANIPSQLNPGASAFTPVGDGSVDTVEIIDQVYDAFDA
nr:nucleocapsid protein [Bat alphacoronavirus PH201]